MTMQIAVIDPYIVAPAVHCFNGLVELSQKPMSYHQPSQMGLSSLLNNRSKYRGYVVLGSASHVHQNLDWHAPLADFLVEELKASKPVLGCCFGHQLVCNALGSTVEYHSDENTKIQGVRSIKVTENFWNFKEGEEFKLAVTHKQVVTKLAPGLRAVGSGLLNDIVIHDTLPFLGTQAHPEASHHFCSSDISNMTEREKEQVRMSGNKLILRFFNHFNLA